MTFDWSIAGPFVILCCLVTALIAPSVVRDVREANRARAKAAEPAPEEEHRIGARCRRSGPNDGHEYRRNAQGDLYCIREDCDEYISQVSA